MKKHALSFILALFVLLDLGYTFVQSYQLPLDGDLSPIVLPAADCRQVLGDPFGWAALTRHEIYVAPNRFFAHAAMVVWFKSVPLALQRFISPISSVYAACALFAVLVQSLLLYVLGVYISGSYRLGGRWWLAVALVVPLFQMAGYNDQMGIIDQCITYTFFYAFPMALLLLLLLPFYRAAFQGQPMPSGGLASMALVGLMVVLAFNGVIVTAAMGVLFVCIALHWAAQLWRVGARLGLKQGLAALQSLPRRPLVLLGIFGLLCLYSIYLGLFERESLNHSLPLWERYTRIPAGILWQYRKLGMPLLTLAVLANAQLLRRLLPQAPGSQRALRLLRWLGIFALIFLLLLPLGGYREYRELIVRRDSVLPLILGMVLAYGLSTYILLQHLPARPRRWYRGAVVAFSLIYLYADRHLPNVSNACERANLARLEQATEPVVRLSADCTLMSWEPLPQAQDSELNAQLFEYWNINKGGKLYYQQGQ
ncbi:hypothetical protein ACFST9_24510 [Hymenobacter monticola]|uniref:Glycosyltransferase RgtA/B/C/D-like domain-containing protein n=1 Tax=Hymenobacter monticola TaxID=1705399 RepID=A0ABY4B9A2_9BACT|nr:hypothetical protein [Hymenobacter monticola]UOE34862.1 hypothetical protein MTP16_04220 [Hymenobacter monticola]